MHTCCIKKHSYNIKKFRYIGKKEKQYKKKNESFCSLIFWGVNERSKKQGVVYGMKTKNEQF